MAERYAITDCIRIVSTQLVNGTGRLLVPVAGSEHRCTTVFDLDTGGSGTIG